MRLSTELKALQAAKLEVTPRKVQDDSLAGWQSVSGTNLSVGGTNFVPSSAQLFVCAEPTFPGEEGRGGSLRSGCALGTQGGHGCQLWSGQCWPSNLGA